MKYTLLLALVACHHTAEPTANLYGYGAATGRFVIGAKVMVDANWNATCTDWGAVIDHATDKHDHHGEDETKPCRKKAFSVELACSAKCTMGQSDASVGHTSVYVIPLEVGPLTVEVTSKRTDNGETKQFSFPLSITLPDKLELHCAQPNGGSYSSCGPDGVPATDPTIIPVVLVEGGSTQTTLLRINGKPHPHDDTHKLSLAELYPDDAVGRGIKPGTYAVTLEVGGMVSKWQVVAQ